MLYADLEISLAILKEPNISQPSHTANRALAELLLVPSTRWIFWAEHYPARTGSTPAHRL